MAGDPMTTYFCNKCGYVGETGPGHEGLSHCTYLAIAVDECVAVPVSHETLPDASVRIVPKPKEAPLTVHDFVRDYHWHATVADAFGLGCTNHSSYNDPDVEFFEKRIMHVIAQSEGENDGPEWLAILELYPGSFPEQTGRYAFITAGADFTGHG